MQLSPFLNQIFLVLFLATGIHSIYLAFFIFIKSKRQSQLKLLGFMMIPVTFLLLNYLLYISGIIVDLPHFMGVFVPFCYLIAPCYYFFILKTINENHRFSRFDLLHLLPFVYMIVGYVPYYVLSVDEKLILINNVYQHSQPGLIELIWSNKMIWILLAYIIAAGFYLKKKLSDSNFKHLLQRILWLYRFTLIFGYFILGYLTILGIFWTLQIGAATFELIVVLLISIGIHLMSYSILSKEMPFRKLVAGRKTKYLTSPLSQAKILEIGHEITQYLHTQKPWLNSGYSISDLSLQLSIPRHHISQVLNENLHMNFNDIINSYRIEEVKRRLDHGLSNHYSIVGIAMDCGFQSKSSFQRAFKKMTGMTPTMYLSRVNQ